MASPKILFLCNSDYGQANIYLATIYALLEADASVEVHVGAFGPMEGMVDETNRMIADVLTSRAKIVFHRIEGDSQFAAMTRPESGIMQSWELPLPSMASTMQFLRIFPNGSVPWTPEEFAAIYEQIKNIIKEVQADFTVVDCLFAPGLTLAFQLKLRWTILSPNTIKDFAAIHQPYLAGLWKYPVLGSGFAFPIPPHQVPMNICLNLILAFAVLASDRVQVTTKYLRDRTGDPDLNLITMAEVGIVTPPPPGVRLMVAMSEDLDYPFAKIPDFLVPLGPIVRPFDRLVERDKELAGWLSRGPTLYVNLGTQMALTSSEALEMALALKDVLDGADKLGYGGERKLQIIWKLKRKPTNQQSVDVSEDPEWPGDWEAVRDVFIDEMETDRMRITGWIKVNPNSILQSGHVICSLHHGGANSWAEATCAGVPQVIVSAWIDCHDFGNRIQLARAGIWANKKSMPRWSRLELGDALKAVILGPDAEEFHETARRISRIHPANAGRDKAASIIMAQLNSS
ncbi:UDP-Glycosyltransferase/glycogen phosphorylase [Thozetella sp. PMI_491]|nr:UDP-Glycosyltransferase/glycogen phosphorylase [Thozetella sp. PMI_491]